MLATRVDVATPEAGAHRLDTEPERDSWERAFIRVLSFLGERACFVLAALGTFENLKGSTGLRHRVRPAR
jgi:hypothetical protein